VAPFDLASCVAPFDLASCVDPFKPDILRGSFYIRHPVILRGSFNPPSCVAPFGLCTAGSLCARGLFGPPHPIRVARLSSPWLFCSSCLLNPDPTVLESLPKNGAHYAFCGNFRL
jgi:hypothetical protein